MATEIETLRAQVSAMLEIIHNAWDCASDGYDYDGSSIQEDLLTAGLIEQRPATESDAQKYECEVGDPIYSPTRLMILTSGTIP